MRVAVGVGFGDGVFAVLFAAELDAVSVALCGAAVVAQAVSARPAAAAAIPAAMPRMSRMRQMLVVSLMPPWPSSPGKLARPGAQPARTLLLSGRERLHQVKRQARPAWPETWLVAMREPGEGGSVGPPDPAEVAGHLGARAGDRLVGDEERLARLEQVRRSVHVAVARADQDPAAEVQLFRGRHHGHHRDPVRRRYLLRGVGLRGPARRLRGERRLRVGRVELEGQLGRVDRRVEGSLQLVLDGPGHRGHVVAQEVDVFQGRAVGNRGALRRHHDERRPARRPGELEHGPRGAVRWLDDGADAEGVGDHERGHLGQRAHVRWHRDVEPVVAVDQGELHDQQGGEIGLGGLERTVVGGRVLELPPAGRGHAAEGDVVRQEVERLDGGRGRSRGACRARLPPPPPVRLLPPPVHRRSMWTKMQSWCRSPPGNSGAASVVVLLLTAEVTVAA